MEAKRKVDHEIGFDFTKFPPSKWSDHFLTVTVTESDLDALAKEIEVLKPKVMDMLILYPEDDGEATKRKILIIHFLVSLGLAYHFENEIEHIVKVAFEKIADLIADENDLYTISIMFRVFRQYGHNMSSDVFRRFKEDDEKFKRYLISDFKGMLSFYEALHFRTTTDYILDESLSFTLSHLEPIATGQLACPGHISRLIQKALHIPQHMNIEALVAREYISFYEQEENHDDTLLKLAKLNFKFLQLHYFQELKTITLWWRGLDHTSKLPPNFRERTIEAWLAALMMYFEPQFSLGRIMSAKLYLAITFLDDACDTYASIEEVMDLVNCIERWDPDHMGKLQGHMKTAFKFVMSVYKEYEDILRSQGRLFVLEETIEEFKILVRTNLQLVKWAREDYMPSFDAYIEAGGAEIGSYATITCSVMGLGEIGKKRDFEWLRSRPKVVQVLAAKTRLMDDITDYELIKYIGESGPRALRTRRSAKVADVFRGETCLLPHPRSQKEVDLHSYLTTIPLPLPTDQLDKYEWIAGDSSLCIFRSATTWEVLRPREEIKDWTDVVWFKGGIPKHAFNMWIANYDRLPTRARLASWGLQISPLCPFCTAHDENRDHLLIACDYSRDVWKLVVARCRPSISMFSSWPEMLSWIRAPSTRKFSLLRKLAAQTTIFHLWKQRNNLIHNQVSLSVAVVFAGIDKEMRNIISARKNRKGFSSMMVMWLS